MISTLNDEQPTDPARSGPSQPQPVAPKEGSHRNNPKDVAFAAGMSIVGAIFLAFTFIRGYPRTHLHGTTLVTVRYAWVLTYTAAMYLGIRSYLRDRFSWAFLVLVVITTILSHLLNH